MTLDGNQTHFQAETPDGFKSHVIYCSLWCGLHTNTQCIWSEMDSTHWLGLAEPQWESGSAGLQEPLHCFWNINTTQQLRPLDPHNPPLLGFLNRPEHALGHTHKEWVRSVVLFLEEALNLSSPFLYKGRACTLHSSHTQLSPLDFTLCFQPSSQNMQSKHKRWAHFLSLVVICSLKEVREWLAQLFLVTPDLIWGNF